MITLRNPDFIVSLYCESATVAEGAVVVVGAADFNVKLPAAADPDPASVCIVGLAKNALTAVGALDVVTSGVFPGVAAASITRGQPLTVANTAGGVKPAAPAGGANVGVIGWALESASSGERVAILIKPGAFQG